MEWACVSHRGAGIPGCLAPGHAKTNNPRVIQNCFYLGTHTMLLFSINLVAIFPSCGCRHLNLHCHLAGPWSKMCNSYQYHFLQLEPACMYPCLLPSPPDLVCVSIVTVYVTVLIYPAIPPLQAKVSKVCSYDTFR